MIHGLSSGIHVHIHGLMYMYKCLHIYIYMFAALLSGYVAKRIARENRKKNVTTKNTRHHS